MNSKQTEEKVHELKIWSEYFDDVESGRKPFEVRKNDRGFKVGDILRLREYALGGAGMTDYDLSRHYTGRETSKEITYILDGGQWGLTEGNCVLGLASLPSKPVGDVEEMDPADIAFDLWDKTTPAITSCMQKASYLVGACEMFKRLQRSAKSGYAAAPQKGVDEKKIKINLLWELIQDWQDSRELGEDIHEPKFSYNDVEKEFYDKIEVIDPQSKTKTLDESPSPSEAGDEIEIIDGYTQLAIDKRSLPKDGQHVKFMTENEEFHEGYFVGGDDIFHVTDSKFFFKWHVQQWKVI